MVSPDELRPLVDHLCLGEGVSFMRKLLGEPVDAPVKVSHMPPGGVTLPWHRRYVGRLAAPPVDAGSEGWSTCGPTASRSSSGT
ncbi:MAG: hypothetical protein ACOC97_01650 [Myxococcota bacterium]